MLLGRASCGTRPAFYIHMLTFPSVHFVLFYKRVTWNVFLGPVGHSLDLSAYSSTAVSVCLSVLSSSPSPPPPFPSTFINQHCCLPSWVTLSSGRDSHARTITSAKKEMVVINSGLRSHYKGKHGEMSQHMIRNTKQKRGAFCRISNSHLSFSK